MQSDAGPDDLKNRAFYAPDFNDLAIWLIFVAFYDVVDLECSSAFQLQLQLFIWGLA